WKEIDFQNSSSIILHLDIETKEDQNIGGKIKTILVRFIVTERFLFVERACSLFSLIQNINVLRCFLQLKLWYKVKTRFVQYKLLDYDEDTDGAQGHIMIRNFPLNLILKTPCPTWTYHQSCVSALRIDTSCELGCQPCMTAIFTRCPNVLFYDMNSSSDEDADGAQGLIGRIQKTPHYFCHLHNNSNSTGISGAKQQVKDILIQECLNLKDKLSFKNSGLNCLNLDENADGALGLQGDLLFISCCNNGRKYRLNGVGLRDYGMPVSLGQFRNVNLTGSQTPTIGSVNSRAMVLPLSNDQNKHLVFISIRGQVNSRAKLSNGSVNNYLMAESTPRPQCCQKLAAFSHNQLLTKINSHFLECFQIKTFQYTNS
ncbi:hypothetical protein L9F63_001039, partial [Diploptera punctata]